MRNFINIVESVIDAADRFRARRDQADASRSKTDHPRRGDPITRAAFAPGGRTQALNEPRTVLSVEPEQPYADRGLWQVVTDRGEKWHVARRHGGGWYKEYPDHVVGSAMRRESADFAFLRNLAGPAGR